MGCGAAVSLGVGNSCFVMHSFMGSVPLALSVLPVCRKHWQSQWHTSKYDGQSTGSLGAIGNDTFACWNVTRSARWEMRITALADASGY